MSSRRAQPRTSDDGRMVKQAQLKNLLAIVGLVLLAAVVLVVLYLGMRHSGG